MSAALDPKQLAYAQEVVHYMTVACCAIYFFEYITTVPKEAVLYYNRGWGALKSSVVWIFIVLRYSALIHAIVEIYGGVAGAAKTAGFTTCVAVQVGIPITMLVLTNYACNCLFTLRVYALSNRNKFVTSFLLVLGTFQIPPAIAYGLSVHAIPSTGTSCAFKIDTQTPLIVFYGMGLLFDLVAFAFTAWYLLTAYERLGFWTPVAKAVFEDGAAYLMAATSIQLVNILCYTAIKKETYLQGVASMLILITAIAGQRVVLHHLYDFSIRGTFPSRIGGSSGGGSQPRISGQGLRSYKSSQTTASATGGSGPGTATEISFKGQQGGGGGLHSPPGAGSYSYEGPRPFVQKERYEYEMA